MLVGLMIHMSKSPLFNNIYQSDIFLSTILEELIEIVDHDIAQLEKVKKLNWKLIKKTYLIFFWISNHIKKDSMSSWNIKGIIIEPEWRDDLMKEIALGLLFGKDRKYKYKWCSIILQRHNWSQRMSMLIRNQTAGANSFDWYLNIDLKNPEEII